MTQFCVGRPVGDRPDVTFGLFRLRYIQPEMSGDPECAGKKPVFAVLVIDASGRTGAPGPQVGEQRTPLPRPKEFSRSSKRITSAYGNPEFCPTPLVGLHENTPDVAGITKPSRQIL